MDSLTSLIWLLLPVLLPLLLSGFASMRPASWLLALAALPALLLAIFNPLPAGLDLDWLLLGIRLGLDETGRLFLAASALVWLLSALYAAGSLGTTNAARFRVFFLLAMSGNFTLILAQDVASFYLGFTLMGLSAYGLVAHRTTELARRAGRLYLAWTISGEVLLFSALVLLVGHSGSTDFASLGNPNPPQLVVALIVLGFGIKLALPGLHLWLPSSYAAAPAAGVAVLSGPMISAGYLGWLRFLPPGPAALIPWGEALIVVGLVGVALGVGIGLLQTQPKLVLGYSSISKMGLLCSGFGIALAQPASAPLLLSALLLYSLHHLLVKSALFLGVDLLARSPSRHWALLGLGLLGLALIGAPLTSGALAKARLVTTIPAQSAWFITWLSIAAVTTTLLMGRLGFLLSRQPQCEASVGRSAWVAWSLLLVIIIGLPFGMAAPRDLLSGGLPLALGGLAVWLVWLNRPRRLAELVGLVPPGDILHPLRRFLSRLLRSSAQRLCGFASASTWQLNRAASDPMNQPGSKDQSLLPTVWNLWRWAGTVWLGVAGLVLMALLLTS